MIPKLLPFFVLLTYCFVAGVLSNDCIPDSDVVAMCTVNGRSLKDGSATSFFEHYSKLSTREQKVLYITQGIDFIKQSNTENPCDVLSSISDEYPIGMVNIVGDRHLLSTGCLERLGTKSIENLYIEKFPLLISDFESSSVNLTKPTTLVFRIQLSSTQPNLGFLHAPNAKTMEITVSGDVTIPHDLPFLGKMDSLTSLTIMCEDGASLNEISAEFFASSHLPSLKRLTINGCGVKLLRNAFVNLPELEDLNLQSNNLGFVPPLSLKFGAKINLTANSVVCDYALKQFLQWRRDNEVRVAGHCASIGSQTNYKGYRIVDVDYELLTTTTTSTTTPEPPITPSYMPSAWDPAGLGMSESVTLGIIVAVVAAVLMAVTILVFLAVCFRRSTSSSNASNLSRGNSAAARQHGAYTASPLVFSEKRSNGTSSLRNGRMNNNTGSSLARKSNVFNTQDSARNSSGECSTNSSITGGTSSHSPPGDAAPHRPILLPAQTTPGMSGNSGYAYPCVINYSELAAAYGGVDSIGTFDNSTRNDTTFGFGSPSPPRRSTPATEFTPSTTNGGGAILSHAVAKYPQRSTTNSISPAMLLPYSNSQSQRRNESAV